MNSLPLRFRKTAIVFAVTAAIATAGIASAKVANPNAVPANSAYVFSAPDVPALWNAWKVNGIYKAFQELIKSPDVSSSMASFNAQLKTIETALGFPLNGDTLSQIFKNADAYVVPGENAGAVSSAFVMQVADQAKLAKLVDLAEKAAASAAAQVKETDEETTAAESGETSPAGKTTSTMENSSGGADGTEGLGGPGGAEDTTSTVAASPITSEEYKGINIKRFSGREDQEFYYAVSGDLFVGSNSRDEIHAIIDRLKTPNSADSIANSANYKKSEGGLQSHPGELYFYVNAKSVAEVGSQPNFKTLENFMKKMAPVDCTATSVKINPKNISAYSYAPLSTAADAAAGRDWIAKNPGNKPLEVLGYAPADTLIVIGTSLVDANALSELISGLMSMSGSSQNMEKQLQQAETTLGFSLKNDLVPAIGNECAFLLNSVSFGGGPIPSVDLAIICKVKDKTKMTHVLNGVEKLLNAMGGSNGSKTSLQTKKVGDTTIKYMELPFAPGLAPGYAMDGEYLLIGTSRDSIEKMIGIKAGKGDGLEKGESYKQLQPQISTTSNGFSMISFKGIWSTAKMVSKAYPAASAASKYIDAASVVSVYGKSSTYKDNAIVAESLLVLE